MQSLLFIPIDSGLGFLNTKARRFIEIVELKEILLELFQKRGINVNRIVVFGSYAKSTEGKDSDIDLIIVSRDFRDKNVFERVTLTRGIHRELVKKVMRLFDIMYSQTRNGTKGTL